MKVYRLILLVLSTILSVSCVSQNSKNVSNKLIDRSVAEDFIACVARNKEKLKAVPRSAVRDDRYDVFAERICKSGVESPELYNCMETYSNLRSYSDTPIWKVSYLLELCTDQQTFQNATDVVSCNNSLIDVNITSEHTTNNRVRRWRYVPFITKGVENTELVKTPFFFRLMQGFGFVTNACAKSTAPLEFAEKAKKCAEKMISYHLHEVYNSLICLEDEFLNAKIDILECVNSYRDSDVSTRIITQTCEERADYKQ